ncbi:MAG: EamA family transporter [Formosa sp.]|jgi:drug/metabolite transporter (DMT)-like permease|nr:EamA family transporter [Formosa sp.]MDA9646656.1 EamA family transporter [Flavobacteriaceae bacterium]MDC0462851.1 EamA family transporter [Flavobacteriaceae bacterium]
MNIEQKKWFYLFLLAFTWGSSFILIKKGLLDLSPLQLGSLRTVLSSLFIFSIGFKSLKTIETHQWKWIVITGLIGTFFPSFLFAYAETEVDSGVVSVLNSLVPLNTVLIGLAVFKIATSRTQVFGVILGFVGASMLIFNNMELHPDQNYLYAGLVVLATVMYASSVNIIKRYLQEVKPLAIATGNFVAIIVPAIFVLTFSNFFTSETFLSNTIYISIGCVIILSLFGTVMAKIVFNSLIQISSPVFASSVAYLMPLVALLWGLLDGEVFGINQGLASLLILLGVYLVNRKVK